MPNRGGKPAEVPTSTEKQNPFNRKSFLNRQIPFCRYDWRKSRFWGDPFLGLFQEKIGIFCRLFRGGDLGWPPLLRRGHKNHGPQTGTVPEMGRLGGKLDRDSLHRRGVRPRGGIRSQGAGPLLGGAESHPDVGPD